MLRVLIAGTLAYFSLVVMLRLSGKRTLSKLNAFDFVVTVALGSTLATVLLSREVPLVEGVLAFAVLILAQYLITALSVRSKAVRRLVKSDPRLLLFRGELLHDALREERITLEEIYAVLRASGRTSIDDVGAIVLETDASIHVLDLGEGSEAVTMRSVRGFDSREAP